MKIELRKFGFRSQMVLFFVLVISCGRSLSAPVQEHAPGGQPGMRSTDLRIGIGDLLEISVYGAPDFEKKEVRVSGSGEITLPLIGAVKVEGMSVPEAQQSVAQSLVAGQFFNRPQVSVLVKEYATQGISVLGEVQKPGVYPLQGPRRLFDAISLAGGLTPKAGRTVSITHRNSPEDSEKLQLGDEVQASTAANVAIYPGDTIVVAKAGIVYVVGDVKLPGGFVIDHGEITVLQALALAQGANPTAKLNSTKLIHSKGNDHQETPVELANILSSKSPDIKLHPDDILFVPNSKAKSAFRRSMEAVLQTAVGAAIYRP